MKFAAAVLVLLFLASHAVHAQETTQNCEIITWHVRPYNGIEQAIWYEVMCKSRGIGLVVTRGETKLNHKLLHQTVAVSFDARKPKEVVLVFANGKKRKYQAGEGYAWAS